MTKAIKNIDIIAIAESIIDDLFDKGQTRILKTGETDEFDLLIKVRDTQPGMTDYVKNVDAFMEDVFDLSVDGLVRGGEGLWADIKPLYEEEELESYWDAFWFILPTFLWWQLQSHTDLEQDRDDFMREFEQDCESYADYYDMVAHQSRDW